MPFGDFEWANRGAIQKRLDEVHANARPGSRANSNFRRGLLQVVRIDHADKLDRSVDYRGRPMADLAPRTLADKRRPPGGPLGTAKSRFRKNFEARWEGTGGRYILVCRFVNLPFAIYHMDGASDPRRNWTLPRRDLRGVTPRGWLAIYRLQAQHARDLRAYGG